MKTVIVLATLISLPLLRVEPAPQEYLDFVCGVRQLDCGDLKPPMVRYAFLPLGILGGFAPIRPHEVLINVTLTDPLLASGVLVHEISHYVDIALDITHARCPSEGEAWRVYHAWIDYHDYPPGYERHNWLDAYRRYGCTEADLR